MEIKKEGTRKEFLSYFKAQIASYIPHIFLAWS